ncbi:MAG: Uma2 family endonuclease [Anaerolineae bacterium]
MVQQQIVEATHRQSPPAGKMSYEEFLAWADEDTLAEWVDGEIIMVSPASDRHQDLVDFLTAVLRLYVASHDLGWVRSAPFQMKTGPDLPGREPDVLFLRKEHLNRLERTYLDGPADLVVEIVSPESVGRDRGEKFYEYEAGGVLEYWLIDPQRAWAECYHLEGDRYRVAFEGQDGEYRARVLPDFWLRVGWLWQAPLPAVEDVLLEVGGAAYAERLIERLRKHGFLPAAEEPGGQGAGEPGSQGAGVQG